MNPDRASGSDDLTQSRLTQVFKFLKELNELRNPVPRDLSGYADVLRLDAWALHPCIVVLRGDREDESDADADVEMEPLISIKRARLTACPKPPDTLDGWLKPGWQSMEAEAEVLESRNFVDREKKTVTVAFSDGAQRVAALSIWTVLRGKWVEAERPAIAALKIFANSYTVVDDAARGRPR